MGFALTPGEAPLHFSRSKNVMHVGLQSMLLCYLMINTGRGIFVKSRVKFRKLLINWLLR